MQPTELSDGKKSTKGDEESINFRPSPNFKHMKKYLKSKFEDENSKMAENHTELEQTPANPVEEKAPQNQSKPENAKPENAKPENAKPAPPPPPPPPPPPMAQPPLPPNPPPPDSPPPAIKQEIIDDEYNQYLTNVALGGGMEDMMPQYVMEMPQDPPKDSGTELTMCRNFVRGTCTKGAACIFAHVLLLDQLPGVYTFCRNFQNRQCTFARCKFVHATVFEKEYFYRTGYLPPHALAHLKALPPPPPPPPPPPEDSEAGDLQTMLSMQEIPQGYYTDQTMDMSGMGMPITDMSCAAMPTYMLQTPLPSVIEQQNYYGPSTSAGPSTSTLKRDWITAMEMSAMDEAVYGMTEMDMEEPTLKKCRNCDTIEFRYQYNKNKVENMISSSDELNKLMNQLNAKTQRLCIVLVTLFKPQTQMSGLGGMPTLGEKDQAILEQLNLLLSTNTSMPYGNDDDNLKNLLGNTSNINFQNIMAQLLMNSDQAPMQ